MTGVCRRLSRRSALALGVSAAALVPAACVGTVTSAPAPAAVLPPSWASRRHAYDADRQLYNLTPGNLSRWRAARERVAGGGSAHVTTLLDSITYGVGDRGITSPAWRYSWPGRLRRRLDGRFGSSGTGLVVPWNIALPQDDERWISDGAGIAPFGLHGRACRTVRGDPDDAKWIDFVAECDTFVVHHLGITPAARFLVDGRASTGVTARSRTPGRRGPIVSTVPAGAPGMHVLRVLPPSRDPGAVAQLVGVEAAMGERGVRVSNLALAGLGVAELVLDAPDGTIGMPLTFDVMRADLAVVLITGNDYLGHTPIPRFTRDVTTALRRARAAGGDVLLVTAPQPDPAVLPADGRMDPPLEAYYAALYAVADDEDVPLLDVAARWGPYAQAHAHGLTDDAIHPNDDGSEDIARAVETILMSV